MSNAFNSAPRNAMYTLSRHLLFSTFPSLYVVFYGSRTLHFFKNITAFDSSYAPLSTRDWIRHINCRTYVGCCCTLKYIAVSTVWHKCSTSLIPQSILLLYTYIYIVIICGRETRKILLNLRKPGRKTFVEVYNV